MILLFLVACFFLLGFAHPAHAMELGIQDQGADTQTLITTAHQLGATSARIVAAPGQPHTDQVQAYRAAGLQVQAAILVKRQTTAQDVMSLVRSWRGMVQTISVGNEPELNGVPACTYVRLFNRTAPRLRRMGLTVGFGEFSPVMAFEYIQKIARCHDARRVRGEADFIGVHPYQFFSDPLSRPTERSGVGSWLGLGNLGAFNQAARKAGLLKHGGRDLGGRVQRGVRATEFSYLTSGRYKISMTKAAGLWPRAVKQASKWCDQLVIYGIGEVNDSSSQSWGSASLLDRYGRITLAYRALAKALGRVLPADPVVAPAPQGDLITQLPDLQPAKTLTPIPEPTPAHGASDHDEKPVVVEDPPMDSGTPDPLPVPAQGSSPVADETTDASSDTAPSDPAPTPTPEVSP